MSENKKFVQGNEACVEGALYAGLDFYAGYPITPSTEIAEILSYRHTVHLQRRPRCPERIFYFHSSQHPTFPVRFQLPNPGIAIHKVGNKYNPAAALP